MIDLLADLDPKSFWNASNGTAELYGKLAIALVLGFGLIGALMAAPARLRKPIIGAFTFVSGLYYFLLWAYPSPISRGKTDAPRNVFEGVSFWLSDAQPVVANLTNIIAGFLIGLGIYSLLRIHLRKVVKQQRDWGFSLVLVLSLVAMVIFGYVDWHRRISPGGGGLGDVPTPAWGIPQYAKDLLFDGLLQQMDAAMFSLIAFYILSAAYRAFRARSIEATVMLATAVLMMLSLMGVLEFVWSNGIDHLTNHNAGSPLNNLDLKNIADWVRNTLQTPSIRGLDFGVGIGLLAMALRIWLNLEPMGSEG